MTKQKIKDFVNIHFFLQRGNHDKKLPAYQCKHCSSTYAFHSTRMVKHLLNCKGTTSDIKKIAKSLSSSSELDSNYTSNQPNKRKHTENEFLEDDDVQVEKRTNVDDANKAAINYDISKFMDTISPAEQNILQNKYAKAVYASGKTF